MDKSIYFVRHILPTNSSIIDNKELLLSADRLWGFKFSNSEVCLHDTENGFLVDAAIQSTSLEEAIKEAKALSENIGTYITFVSGDVVSSAIFLFGYDFSDNKSEREFRQVIISPVINERIYNPLKEKDFSEVFEAATRSPLGPEIMRSLTFLRVSMQDDLNEIIRFTDLWQGLEVLNNKLMDEYSIPREERYNTCQKCGAETGPKISVGIQRLFEDNNEFHEIRRLRGKIAHGSAIFDYELFDKCTEKNTLLREKLIKAIALLLKLPDALQDRLLQVKRRPLSPKMRIIINARLRDFVPTPLNNINQHNFFISSKSDLYSNSSDNKRQKGRKTFAVISNGTSYFSNIETSIMSYDGSENVIKEFKAQFSFNKNEPQ